MNKVVRSFYRKKEKSLYGETERKKERNRKPFVISFYILTIEIKSKVASTIYYSSTLMFLNKIIKDLLLFHLGLVQIIQEPLP